MKTEFERISEIMYTLLEHQPVIDVPYEKINDIAVALVKEGYGKISEYKAEIERLKAENEYRKKQYDNQVAENTLLHIEYGKSFERLKAQQREIDQLKAETSNIRKETAREILDMLYDMGIDKGILECCRICDVNGVSLAKQICEKYGVEVENGEDKG